MFTLERPEVFFKCSHGVYNPAGVSYCYVTNPIYGAIVTEALNRYYKEVPDSERNKLIAEALSKYEEVDHR